MVVEKNNAHAAQKKKINLKKENQRIGKGRKSTRESYAVCLLRMISDPFRLKSSTNRRQRVVYLLVCGGSE